MIQKPFFSIVIPTYNRSSDLKLGIDCLLRQKFRNFEILVMDNNSSDKTREVATKIKDKRVKYIRNKKDIGWILNIQKGISLAKGEYILLQGDDDFLLDDDCLGKLHNEIKKNPVGFIRLNYMSWMRKSDKFFDFNVNKKYKKNNFFSPQKTNEEVFDFIHNTDPFFITGIIFKNKFPRNISIINSELAPWLKILFYNVKNYGGLFLSSYFYICTWPEADKKPFHPFFHLDKGNFKFEEYLKEIDTIAENNYYRMILNKRLNEIISLFPANKFSTGNKNLLRCVRRVLYLNPKNKFKFNFWFWLFFSLIVPTFVLSLAKKRSLRKLYQDSENLLTLDIKRKIDFLNKMR